MHGAGSSSAFADWGYSARGLGDECELTGYRRNVASGVSLARFGRVDLEVFIGRSVIPMRCQRSLPPPGKVVRCH